MTIIKKLLNFILKHDSILDFLLLVFGVISIIFINSLEYDPYLDNVLCFIMVFSFLCGFFFKDCLYIYIDFFKSIKNYIIRKKSD